MHRNEKLLTIWAIALKNKGAQVFDLWSLFLDIQPSLSIYFCDKQTNSYPNQMAKAIEDTLNSLESNVLPTPPDPRLIKAQNSRGDKE